MASKQPPIIGITCRGIQAAHNHHPTRVGLSQTYVNALLRAGAAPLLLPNVTDKDLLRAIYQSLDGLLLSGGGDIHPARYGEAIHEKCGRITPERDETEMTLTCWAVDDGLPLLAICRGIQVLNVALGGSLYQDIQAQVPGAMAHTWYPNHPRDLRAHDVAVSPGTRLADIMGTPSMGVNSLHHQAVKEVAPRLVVTARAPDELVEALEVEDHPFAVAVQWHPEELAPDDAPAQRLFDALVEASQS